MIGVFGWNVLSSHSKRNVHKFSIVSCSRVVSNLWLASKLHRAVAMLETCSVLHGTRGNPSIKHYFRFLWIVLTTQTPTNIDNDKQAVKHAAKGAVAAGSTATKNVAAAGAQSARNAGKRASGKLWDTMPKIGSYATWTGRRLALLLLGTAFLYGLGSSLPGAVARYYVEKDRRRDEEERRKGESGGGGGESLSRAVEGGGAMGEAVVERSSLTLLGAVERWMRER